ncbi:MAG: oligosaccharide repeat unit polymerase [Gemmatimonadota bacterium]|nr:oligosaccharide repeat unit polymerase [Gemmatimonadota bacterium]
MILASIFFAIVFSLVAVLNTTENTAFWLSLSGVGVLLAIPVIVTGFRGEWDPFEPIFMVNTALALYFVMAPAADLLDGREYFFGKHITSALPGAFLVAALGIASMTVAYYSGIARRVARLLPTTPPMRPGLARYGIVVGVLAVLLFGVYLRVSQRSWTYLLTFGQLGSAPGIDPGSTTEAPLTNYLYSTLNWLITSFMILFASMRRGRVFLALAFFPLLAMLMTIGFRYKVLVFVLAPVVYTYLKSGRRPRLVQLMIIALLGFLVVGGLGTVRDEFREGMEVQAPTWSDISDAFLTSLSIYQPYVAIVDAFPEERDFLGGQSYAYLFYQPIPRGLWPSKPEPPVKEIIRTSFGGEAAVIAGVAYPNIGEMYAEFGALGVSVGMGLFGLMIRTLYEYLRRHPHDLWVRMSYALALPYLVQVISRGHFVGVVHDLVFLFLPIVVGMWLLPHSRNAKQWKQMPKRGPVSWTAEGGAGAPTSSPS